MNSDKAYILGLVIGGGCFSIDNKSFHIRLPYKQWGEAAKNPERAGLIAQDILKVVRPLMDVEYGLNVSYTIGREWRIVCIGDLSRLIKDLHSLNIEPSSELHKTADLSTLISKLVDKNLKKRFIAGVADTIGSMAPSHRRFSDDVQIISFEISGFNYKFVCQLCNLLYELGCVPDQILWQHPNMQSGNDAYYPSWKKGNKLRVTLDSFSTYGSMAFKSKVRASRENMVRETTGTYNAAIACEKKSLSVPGIVCVHQDENAPSIPEPIRGGHYIHHKQICAVLDCPHAPCDKLDLLLRNAEYYISPFSVLTKDTKENIDDIVGRDPLLKNRKYTTYHLALSTIQTRFDNGYKTICFDNGIIFSETRTKGYPLNVILDAMAYVVASQSGQLNGKRPRGNREEIIKGAIGRNPDYYVEVSVPDLLTPMILTDGKVAALVGPLNPEVYKRLISYSAENRYKMYVRKITEKDLM